MNLFVRYNMCLHTLNSFDLKECNARIPLDFVDITENNIDLVLQIKKEKRIYKKFKKQLAMGDYGYYAVSDGKVIGYGWCKNPGSKDLFYKIDKNCNYLGGFFVSSEYRGNNVYPALITKLVKKAEYSQVCIGAYDYNTSSLNGLTKPGFAFVRKDTFFRFLKRTLNKKSLINTEKIPRKMEK